MSSRITLPADLLEQLTKKVPDGSIAELGPAGIESRSPQNTSSVSPYPTVAPAEHFTPERDGRGSRLSAIHNRRSDLQATASELKRWTWDSPERKELFKTSNRIQGDIDRLEDAYRDDFVPLHSAGQLISPQQLLMSRLFNVRGKATPREELVSFNLGAGSAKVATYRGPELRQLDGLVFMALINLARDIKVGTLVSFEPREICRWLYGYYDGDARTRLKESIYRMQHAVLKFTDFSVQLTQRFNYPKKGRWAVMMDPEIVALFGNSHLVWMDLEIRRTLPDGLTSWLFGYVESQSRLIPRRTWELQDMCGSEAKDDRSFQIMLRRALKALVAKGVLHEGWLIKDGMLHWLKAPAGIRSPGEATLTC